MDNILLEDSYKKESKFALGIMIFTIVISIGLILAWYFREEPTEEIIKMSILCGLFSLFGIYYFLYNVLYHVTVTEEKIIKKSLFGKEEICFTQIKEYSYKRYNRNSEIYIFKLYTEKKCLIYTRYPDKFKEILDARIF